MKHHAAYTYYILSEIDDFEEIRDWVAFHHERLDGTGYPFGKHEKAYGILKDMAEKGWLDADIVAMVDECFDKQNKIK